MDHDGFEKLTIASIAKIMKMDPAVITMDLRWKEDIKAKSMHVFMITALLEDGAGFKVPISRVLKNSTVGDCVKMLEEIQANT